MTHVSFGVEPVAIERGDAAGLLTSMLERVQAQSRNGRRIGRIEDSEYSALQPRLVIVGVSLIERVPGIWRHQRDFSTASSRPLRAA
jgi:hypothetical protein